MTAPGADARYLARLAMEMRGSGEAAGELLARAAAFTVIGAVRHSEVAIVLTHALAPILEAAGLIIVPASGHIGQSSTEKGDGHG